ncbi:MAG: hypothetical protein ACKVJG_15750 [Candidatus Latescibacterota bacterium]|jgi:hypothetical protein|tara:strand:- start:641 stop:898 length:258 start_codon:yes stop_codon:yes gene_type:complete
MADEDVEKPERKSIPIPADFAFTWAESKDAERTWNLDGTHFPEAMPPLEFDYWHSAIRGIYHLQKRLDAPNRMLIRYINGYFYMG